MFYGRLFEIAPAVKRLLRGDMTEQGCNLMATFGVVVNRLGNHDAVLADAMAHAPESYFRGGGQADDVRRPVADQAPST
jgi:hypothetical protein